MTQAEIFRQFMKDVWESEEEEAYDKFHNANEVARTMGGTVTGNGCDESWNAYLFPDGSTAEAMKDGSGTDGTNVE